MSAEATADIERIVDICGRPVRVRVHGEGHPVLLINGLGANVATDTVGGPAAGIPADLLRRTGYRPLQVPGGPYRIAHIAEVARRVLDEVGVERADVLGYSLGGAVAQQLAYQEPERVRRLILVSSSCGIGQIPGPLRAAFAVMTPARHYAKPAHRAAMRLVGLAPAEKDLHISELITGWHQQASPSVMGYTLQVTAFSAFHSLPWLHRITQPTLVISGTDDNLMPMANSAVLAAYLGDARLHIVERWGHYLLHDAASGAAATIADFFGAASHDASSAWRNARTVNREDLPSFSRPHRGVRTRAPSPTGTSARSFHRTAARGEVAVTGSPAWRRAFDGVERQVGPPLRSLTSSSELQIAGHQVHSVIRAVTGPVEGLVSWGLHVAGLPSHADIRGLRRQLVEVQRELLALRREVADAERDREGRR